MKEAAISQYQKIINLTDGLDYVTQDPAIDLLSDEQEHRRLFWLSGSAHESVGMSHLKKDRLLERYIHIFRSSATLLPGRSSPIGTPGKV